MAWICERVCDAGEGPWRLADLAVDAELQVALKHVFADESVSPTVASRTVGGVLPGAATIRWTLLDGPLGPLALLAIDSPSQPAVSATRDALTQLPDRLAISALVDQWRREAAPAEPRFALLFVDFDRFKSVNDEHGHLVGDIVLKTLADRLQRAIRDGDLAARYGGDEFVLLIRSLASAADVGPVLTRLAAAIEQPLDVNGATLRITATIGWAIPQGAEWTPESLIASADADMYARKRSSPG